MNFFLEFLQILDKYGNKNPFPGGQLITDTPDSDPQHCLSVRHLLDLFSFNRYLLKLWPDKMKAIAALLAICPFE